MTVPLNLRGHRDPAIIERDLARFRRLQPHLFPQLEKTPDVSRGEQRLAAEFALAQLRGEEVPGPAFNRAFNTLKVLATG